MKRLTREQLYEMAVANIIKNPKNQTNMTDYTKQVKTSEILKEAEKSPEVKQALLKLFPECFEDEYFEFGPQIMLTTDDTQPIYIGKFFARSNDEFKVLLVNRNYELEVIENYNTGLTGIKLKKRRSQF
jgi:hypothetical protein